MSIVLARVDDRLIHGQVMTSWLNYTGANKIVVIDDVTANDSFLTMILKSLVPANIQIVVCTQEQSVSEFAKLLDEDKVIVLTKNPAPYVHLVENGIEFPWINIGGMGIRPGRSTLYKNIAASEEEREQFAYLVSKGLDVKIQMVAEDNAVDVKNFI